MPKKDPSPLQLAQKAGDVLKKKVNFKAFASTSTALSRSDGPSLYFFVQMSRLIVLLYLLLMLNLLY